VHAGELLTPHPPPPSPFLPRRRSRYTWWNFLPLFLLEQFARFANFYFLIVSVLQCIPAISITNGAPTNFFPLGIVLAFDGIVTAREDYKRHVDDDKANNSKSERARVFGVADRDVMASRFRPLTIPVPHPTPQFLLAALAQRGGRFQEITWAAVRVGDVLKVERNHPVPADCVFLSSSTADAPDTRDSCYVQTAQLDGETNLKLKQALHATSEAIRTDADAVAFRGTVVCEAPTAAFDKFVGMLHVGSGDGGGDGDVAASGAAVSPGTVPNAMRAVSSMSPDGAELVLAPGQDDAAAAASAADLCAPRPLPLEADQLLLRGSILRNVDHAYVLVVYTGRETKVRVRQTSRPLKRAQVEVVLNKLILALVVCLVAFCLIGAIGAAIWSKQHLAHSWYLIMSGTVALGGGNQGGPGAPPVDLTREGVGMRFDGLRGVQTFFTFFLLNAGFIPVSLYVTVRLARSFQMLVMEWDLAMYHEEPALVAASGGLDGAYPFRVRTMDLNDELGQITHVFSDKTGTLTLNVMEFRKLIVDGISYGLGTTTIGIDRLRREGRDVADLIAQMDAAEARRQMDARASLGNKAARGAGAAVDGADATAAAAATASTAAVPPIPHVNFEDGSETHPGRTLGSDARDPCDGAQGGALHRFLLHLTLNHSVLRETVRDSAGHAVGTRLSASSPDEEAFLFAAESFGYTFLNRLNDVVLLRVRHPAHALPLERVAKPVPADLRAASQALVQRALPRSFAEGGVGAGGGAGGATGAGTILPFRVLHTLAYSQERKRMGVVIQHPVLDADGVTPVLLPPPVRGGAAGAAGAVGGAGEVVLYCKGADSVILARLRQLQAGEPPLAGGDPASVRRRTVRTLAEWGNDGLRTLCFAERPLPDAVFRPWSSRYAAALSDLEEVRRKKSKQPNAIDRLMDDLENGLHLQGATANEDKLQPEVPETIAMLAKAGVRTWMVTGDKQETAVNIGFATRLLDDTMRQVVATAESAGGVQAALKRIRIAAKRMRAERSSDRAMRDASRSNVAAAVEWMNRRVEALGAALGADDAVAATAGRRGEGDHSHTEIDIDAAAEKMEADAALGGIDAAPPSVLQRLASRAAFRPRASSQLQQQQQQAPGGAASAQLDAAGVAAAAKTATVAAASATGTWDRSRSGTLDTVGPGTPPDAAGTLTASSARSRAISYASEEGENDIAQADSRVADTAIGHVAVVKPAAVAGEAAEGEGEGEGEGEAQGSPLLPAAAGTPPAAPRPDASSHHHHLGPRASGTHPTSDHPSSFSTSTASTPLKSAAAPSGSPPPPSPSSSAAVASRAVDLASSLLTLPPLLGPQRRPYALVIDEAVLDAALAHPRAKAYLLYVSVNCAAVIACRARPDQKAAVVRLIRHGVPTSRTLAIGDGANDVDMISGAHVGVGIAGAEGVVAANSSDFSIGRFRFLQRLLLVHGRWNYSRMTRLVLYMFWKNIVFVLSQFAFQFYNGFSGQKWFLEYGTQTYNLIYTGLPVLLMAVLDRDLDAEWSLRYPKLYDWGRLGRGLNLRVFLDWVLDAVLMAALNVGTILAAFTVPDGAAKINGATGATPYTFAFGLLALTNVVLIVNIRIALESHFHNFLFQAAVLGSTLIWVPAVFIFDVMRQDNFFGGATGYFGSAAFWLTSLLVVGAATAKFVLWRAWKRLDRPSFYQVVQEAAFLTHDTAGVDAYADAADLARRTGKSLPEVVEAQRLASAAASALAPVLDAADKAGIPRRDFAAFHQRAAGVAGAAQPAGERRSVTLRAARIGGREEEDDDAEAASAAAAAAGSFLTTTPLRPLLGAVSTGSSHDYQALSSGGQGTSKSGDSGSAHPRGAFPHTRSAPLPQVEPLAPAASAASQRKDDQASFSIRVRPPVGEPDAHRHGASAPPHAGAPAGMGGPASSHPTHPSTAVSDAGRRILESALLPPRRNYSFGGGIVLEDGEDFDHEGLEGAGGGAGGGGGLPSPLRTSDGRGPRGSPFPASPAATHRRFDVALPPAFAFGGGPRDVTDSSSGQAASGANPPLAAAAALREAHVSHLRDLSRALEESIRRLSSSSVATQGGHQQRQRQQQQQQGGVSSGPSSSSHRGRPFAAGSFSDETSAADGTRLRLPAPLESPQNAGRVVAAGGPRTRRASVGGEWAAAAAGGSPARLPAAAALAPSLRSWEAEDSQHVRAAVASAASPGGRGGGKGEGK
jgi:magnesium-transporting ATPase (P-type)